MSTLTIGINGGGIGGMTAAIALRLAGHNVVVFEQAPNYSRIGADVNLTPNAVHALDRLGVGQKLRDTAAQPTYRISRMWDTGEETSRLEMADNAEKKYGAPQLTIHRADLLKVLKDKLPDPVVILNKRAEEIVNSEDGVVVCFSDGTKRGVDALIGADGIHSVVRTTLFGKEKPEFTGLISYRSVVQRNTLFVTNLDAFTKWWGPTSERQIVTFPLNRNKETFVFATTPQEDWRRESWTITGDVRELRKAYLGFHPEARALLDGCSEVTKSALYIREPMPVWSVGRTTLLGDACHPMMPFMAQGACMAIEDSIVLSRILENVVAQEIPAKFKDYEEARKARTDRIQRESRGNQWLKEGGNADWVYGYDAWSVSL